MVWDKNITDQGDLELTAAPLAIKDLVLIGGSGGDRGVRNRVAPRPENRRYGVEDVFNSGAR